MEQKNYAGIAIDLNEDGYMVNMDQWNKDVAVELAKEEDIELTDKHFEVLEYIRNKVKSGETLTIRAIGKSGIVEIKGFYQLFPGGPLKKATKIAGVLKPASCV